MQNSNLAIILLSKCEASVNYCDRSRHVQLDYHARQWARYRAYTCWRRLVCECGVQGEAGTPFRNTGTRTAAVKDDGT